jgi:hypothetical protein
MDMLIMDKFVHRENLAHFKKLIAEAKDDIRREMLLKLLAEEEAKDEGGVTAEMPTSIGIRSGFRARCVMSQMGHSRRSDGASITSGLER